MMPRRQLYFVGSVFQDSEEPIDYNVQHHNVQHFQHEILPSKYHILYINIKSLDNKLDDLEFFIHRLHTNGINIYIIAVTEINISEETSKYQNLLDYNAFYSTNATGKGGVALFIHKSLACGVIENVENNDINCLIANIPVLKVNVGVLYKNPNVPIESLLEYYDIILRKDQRTLLLGDVNIDLLKQNTDTKQYTDAVRRHQYSILNQIDSDSATRGNSRRNGTAPKERVITDHVFANVKDFKYSLSLCNVLLSENKIIVLGFDDNKPDKIEFVAEPSVAYKMVDFQCFNEQFSKIDLRKIRSFDSLVSQVLDCKEESIVQKKRYPKKRIRPWIYAESLTKSERFTLRSKIFAQQIDKCSDDPEKYWETIEECLKNKTSGKPFIVAIYKGNEQNKQVVVEKKTIASILNGFFLNIGRVLRDRVPRTINIGLPVIERSRNFIQPISTTCMEVEEKIKQMKNSNCFHDIISANTLKYHAHKLAPILARLFNDCCRTGEYPNSLKIDRIVPAYKTLDPLEPKNYRPIGIAPFLSKLLEFIMCDRITKFCEQNDIIDKDQYGFQKNSSAMSAVVAVLDYLQVGLNEEPGSIGAGLFIDLEKASNTIPHDLLMQKLSRLGIRGSVYRLIESYLYGRRQFVVIDNTVSDQAIDYHGFSIPQGSALGPLFLLLYLNDIFQLKLHGKLVLFADDIAVVYVETNAYTLKRYMENDFRLLQKWFNENGLTLNVEKTKAMLFNAVDIVPQINLMIRGKPIAFVESYKYLGLYLQSNLKWDVHINTIIREVLAASNASKKFGDQVNKKVSFEIYQRLVYSRFLKMAAIYGRYATKVQMKNLQVAQDMAIKSIFSGVDNYNVNEIYASHRLLKVKDIIRYDLAMLIYKVKHKLLKLNRTVNDINGNNILSAATRHFESLPSLIQNQTKLIQFKRNFKRSCIQSY